MSKTPIRTLLFGAALALAVAPWPAQAEPGVTDDEIVIGMFSALSGPLMVNGADPLNAARAYYEDVNARGGIHGRKIRTVIEDDKCVPAESNAVARKLIAVDNVFLLNGGACSGAVVALQDLVNREKVPHVFINASGDTAVFPPTRYQFGSIPGTQRSTMAAVVSFSTEQLKGKRLALIGPDDDMGRAAYRFVKAVVEKGGAELVAYEVVPNNATDVTVPIVNVRAAKPDVLMLATYPAPTILVVQKAYEYGLDLPIVSAIQGVSSAPEVFAKSVGDNGALENFYYTVPLAGPLGGPELKPFYDLFAKYNPDRDTPTLTMPYGFPSAMAVVKALELAGRDLTREKFVDALEQVDFDSGIMVSHIKFGPDRRDAMRGQVVLKYDGETLTRMPDVYEWDQIVPPDSPALN
ncbi:ABC transporter substrate-binding protein [Acuticoccus sp. I52.16.1]|uniref:ABC transporter substrate-binding protein n=1 Tax=Acuticoccus sp. I52.16.1 TaxID=2928472 RepID=UPI001FD03B1F|nr:ABC transporter substrate-binding protein [Acuticoccus sp. I52.16.1]UOM36561.1 ABC transporter substrate-binding protein [Acuticoccus sp. I52.16.1]